MRLPPLDFPVAEWSAALVQRWTALVYKANQMESNAGNNDAFERMLSVLRNMGNSGRDDGLGELLKRRLTARALTWLWLNDEQMEKRLLNPRLLGVLVEAQQPRLTRITLQQLAQLYFRRFDRLDEREGLRELLARTLQHQLGKMPARKIQGVTPDPLETLKNEGSWLLGTEGPSRLAQKVREEGKELGDTLSSLGLQGFDDGRYGDICRAHFYLDTLRHLPLGEWDPVMDELLKPSVSKAPFEGGKRIGHVALEILIDRVEQEPSDAWQNFILNLAGDPRIANTELNFQEWWQRLGEVRIQRVRGWLAKEDLRLFLQAVEQFGIETQNEDLQRMFPARKLFLEGLFKLKLIRTARLLLGGRAQLSVKRILGKDVKTSFARMDGQMNDKAVIYLDCGDFHLVEGSHSFKIWVYLAPPGELLRSYERSSFSHSDLTSTVPATYKKLYPKLPYDAFVHTPNTWQSKVFSFLADNGIGLDIEQLLSKEDYRRQLQKFGIPVVNVNRAVVPSPAVIESKQNIPPAREPQAKPIEARTPQAKPANEFRHEAVAAMVAKDVMRTSEPSVGPLEGSHPVWSRTVLPPFSSLQLAALRYLKASPNCGFYALLEAVSREGGNVLNVRTMLESSLSQYVRKDANGHWLLSLQGEQLLAELDGTAPAAMSVAPGDAPSEIASNSRVSRLEPLALSVLRYFSTNPGDKVRYAANVLGVDARIVNQMLFGPLKTMCAQDNAYGWRLTDAAQRELELFESQER